jgi:hypothetical protein
MNIKGDLKEDYKLCYEYNAESGNYIIDVKLKSFHNFYHDWDNTPNYYRSIHPELVGYLNECSQEIPLKESIEIRFDLDQKAETPGKEKTLMKSYTYYFRYLLRNQMKRIKRVYRQTIFSIIFALILLSLANLLDHYLTETILSSTIITGITVGGWVFMWEAFYTLGFLRPDQRNRIKETQRLLDAPIIFSYS